MLLAAGPSQAAYTTGTNQPLQPYSPAVSRLTISSSSTVSKSNESVRSPQSSSTRFSFMKSISSQLNRGTELLKQTVQRAIFSTKGGSGVPVLGPPITAKPTLYHSDPHAVARSSSVDSLHTEMCHIRPIRPCALSLYSSRRHSPVRCPAALRPDGIEELVIKFMPLRVKGKFRSQLAKGGSAFYSLGVLTDATAPVTQSPAATKRGRGTKRKRNLIVEEEPDTELAQVVPQAASKRGRKAPSKKSSTTTTTATCSTKKNSKRKSLEQERQEREDFELAKRLQKELNSSNESVATNGTTVTTSTTTTTNGGTRSTRSGRVNSSYSLRTTRSLSKFSHSSVSPAAGVVDAKDCGQLAEKKPKNGLKPRNKRIATKRNNSEPPPKEEPRNGKQQQQRRSTKRFA